jgi:hypothetical protein
MKTPSSLAFLALCMLVALSQVPHEAAGQPVSVTIRVDPRVELVSIMFRLAGNREYNQHRLPSYVADIEAHFDAFRDHPAIAFARGLSQEKGIGYDACMSMAIYLTDVAALDARVPFETAEHWPARWTRDDARAFVEHARTFVEDTRFEAFFEEHQPLYDLAETRMRQLLAEQVDLAWFGDFFGAQPGAEFVLALGMGNGGGNFGPKFIAPDGTEELYAIMGVWLTDDEGLPRFDASVTGLIIHEFNHSFVNPVMEQHFDEIGEAGEAVFAAVASQMARQAYGDWRTMVNESLVRAAVVRYFMKREGGEAAAQEIDRQKRNYFVWIDELSDLLAQYETVRDTYPTFESFLPHIATFFHDLAPRITDFVLYFEEELDAQRPQVVEATPPNGAEDVDPALTEIVFRFDRPMNTGSYSVMTDDEDGDEYYPEVAEVGFDETGTVFTMKVTLKPNHRYAFSLNSPTGGAFRSRDGIPLAFYPVAFHTGPARDEP